jgi:hypothetical protein
MNLKSKLIIGVLDVYLGHPFNNAFSKTKCLLNVVKDLAIPFFMAAALM